MKSSERGSAVIFILLAIALFAALAFSFIKSGQQSVGSMSAQKASLAASEVLEYAQRLERTVDKLRRNGCSEKDLSYYIAGNTSYADYAHTPTTPDECNILNASGGGMSPPTFNEEGYLDPAVNSTFYTNEAELIYLRIDDVGTTANGEASNDLLFYVRGLTRPICEQINQKLKLSIDLNYATYVTFQKYNGSFAGGANLLAQGGFSGVTAACYSYNGADSNFYYVVLAR